MLDIIALVVAICAFVVSIVVPVFEFIWNNRMNKNNLKAEYFRDVYGEILYQDIPMALSYIHYNGTEVTGTKSLCDVLRKIRFRSVYFKVADADFYNKLIDSVQDLEDYIIQSPDTMSASQFCTFYGIVNEKIEIVYKHMSEAYIGKRDPFKGRIGTGVKK